MRTGKVKNLFGYKHIKNRSRKRPGRHAKKYSKRIPRRARDRGQG